MTIVLSLIVAEVYSFMPWLSARLHKGAVSRLPRHERQRYEEEWDAHLGASPTPVAKVITAFGFWRAARKISVILIEQDRAQFAEVLADLTSELDRAGLTGGALKTKIEDRSRSSSEELKGALRACISLCTGATSEPQQAQFQAMADSIEAFGRSLTAATGLAWTLSSSMLERTLAHMARVRSDLGVLVLENEAIRGGEPALIAQQVHDGLQRILALRTEIDRDFDDAEHRSMCERLRNIMGVIQSVRLTSNGDEALTAA